MANARAIFIKETSRKDGPLTNAQATNVSTYEVYTVSEAHRMIAGWTPHFYNTYWTQLAAETQTARTVSIYEKLTPVSLETLKVWTLIY